MGTTFGIDISVSEKGADGSTWQLDQDIAGNLTFEDFAASVKRTLIRIASDAVIEEQQKGFDKNPIYIVDGNASKKVEDVNPFGKIDIVSKSDTADILTWAYQSVDQRSPVLTGEYKKHNYVFYNGTFVADSQESFNSWIKSGPSFLETDIIRIVNIQPYARKLERLGVSDGRTRPRTVKSRQKNLAALGIRTQAPNGAYYLAYRSTLQKYKNNSKIRFGFITGDSIGVAGSFATGRRKSVGRSYLYPTITISLNAAGLTDV